MIQKSAIKVIKVGGSILSNSDEFLNVALKIRDESYKNQEIIVVISAMKGVTDRLIEISRNSNKEALRSILEIVDMYPIFPKLKWDPGKFEDILCGKIKEISIDQLITIGERLSSLSLHSLLGNLGIRSTIIDPGDIIYYEGNEKLTSYSPSNYSDFKLLESTPVRIVPGFYGRDKEGNIKAFSRGGSDLTAGIVAGYFEASELEFWKDVGAVMTGDPKIVESPRPIFSINMTMLSEMTAIGSRILHPLSLEYVDLELTRVRIRGIDSNLETTTEVVNFSVNCLSIVISKNSDEDRNYENYLENEDAGIYVLTGGEPEFLNSISSRVRNFFEMIGSGISGKLAQENGMISFRSSYSECRKIANELHRDLFSGDRS